MKPHDKLPYRIETRIDEQKFLELQSKLKNSQYRSMSELLRDIVYYKKIVVVTHDKSLDKVMERLSAIRSELHAIGVNINQITRYFNSEGSPTKKVYHSMQTASLFESVGKKVDELYPLITELGKKWLQK
ncbi:hypothetical protein A9P82_08025 [Arachidicoccus ginsenosidimutans]|uniref:plasmid mobilization protein n=1 Tax=Arachidicoccus sp. BS20 TaxID=1850526 RepID=UPI0007F0B1DD|nr:plasmid mobilization relaxosome protein MobC [Arachidicoccus sp. BS20]ANI89242.1 hypothetical protein A9P82_08025 [Arachidicoccus sp. BS20]